MEYRPQLISLKLLQQDLPLLLIEKSTNYVNQSNLSRTIILLATRTALQCYNIVNPKVLLLLIYN